MSIARSTGLVLLLMIAGAATAKPPLVPKVPQLKKPSLLDGVWKTETGPPVTLSIEDKGGKVQGTIQFASGDRKEEAQPMPLLAPRIKKQKELTFELWHLKGQEGPDYGPNRSFRLKWEKPGQAVLEEIGSKHPAPALTLTRQLK